MLDRKNFYIDGKWVLPVEPKNFKVIDPSNEEICAEISIGGKKDGQKWQNSSLLKWVRQ